MSHFYASIPEAARKTVATARGHKTTGITVKAASWAGAVEIRMFPDEETGKAGFTVYQVPHHGEGIDRLLHEGIVGEWD